VRHVDGLGLGLSIVEDCIQALGGTIEVESVEGTGTIFVLTLPMQSTRAEVV
jgi:signal transduction histidine kinase